MFDLASFIADHVQKDRPFVAPVKTVRKGRQSKNPVDWKMVDLAVFKAMLLLSFNGGSIAKVIETCPCFARKDAVANRNIIRQSLANLQDRGLVKISDKGRDQWITAANGCSMASYYPRGENPPVAVVWRRPAIKSETVQENTPEIQENVEETPNQTDPDFFDDDYDDNDFDDVESDLSVE